MSMQKLHTVVIGAGQAGLATSCYLTNAGHEHVVLEKNRLASAWRDERWDSFTLVTPNWSLRLPETVYSGDDPDEFLSREQVVAYLEDFVALFDPPLRQGVEVTAVEASSEANELIVTSSDGGYAVENVNVATGTFQRLKSPDFHLRIADKVEQMHSSEYRNPERIREGAVLIVGSGQSGCQIADELWERGQQVHFATGTAGRIPRRYRGQDSSYWLERMGFMKQAVDQLKSPADRCRPNPHVNGKDGGKTLNLHGFFREGVTLLGHLRGSDGFGLQVAPDLHENLAAADGFAREVKQGVDKFILESGRGVPEDGTLELRDG